MAKIIIGVAKGCNFRRNLQGKFVSVPPGSARVNFIMTFFAGRGRFGGGSVSFSSFRPSKRATTIKKGQPFLCTPDKILATPVKIM